MNPTTIMCVFLGLCVLVTIPAIVLIVRDAIRMVRKASWEYKETSGTAVVINKVHVPSYNISDLIPVGGKMIFPHVRYYPEEYKVYVKFEGNEYEIDDWFLFKHIKPGENVQVIVYTGYDKNGVIQNIYLTRK